LLSFQTPDQVARAAMALACVVLLTECSTSGVVAAELKPFGQDGLRPVSMEYETRRFHRGGTLTATLPSGETFEGRYFRIRPTSPGDTLGTPWGGWGPWHPYWTDWGPVQRSTAGDETFATFVERYSGKVVSLLFGNRGDFMRCRLELQDPDGDFERGGAGECQTSNGDSITVHFRDAASVPSG